MNRQNNSGMVINSKLQRLLYSVGGVSALLAVFVFRRNMGAELMAFHGFGLIATPAAIPVRALDWFTLLQQNTLAGLILLEVFDLVEYVLLGLVFLAVYFALRQAYRIPILIATVSGLVGIVIYIASNQAFAMLSLSEQFTAAASEAQRAALLAAGEGLLAVNNPGILYQGAGIYTSLFLVLLAGLVISIYMLKSGIFTKASGVIGILANVFMMTYFPILVFAPGLIVLPFVISAPLRVTWYFLIAIMLFKLAKVRERPREIQDESL